jgi:hypothetical protein
MIFRKLETEPGPKARMQSSPKGTSGSAAAGLVRRADRTNLKIARVYREVALATMLSIGAAARITTNTIAVRSRKDIAFENISISGLAMLRCSGWWVGTRCPDVIINTPASFLDHVNIE